MIGLTAIIKKGEKQFVSLCPELDVASQGSTIEEALKNLTEACELYIEEMGLPEGIGKGELFVAQMAVNENEIACPIGA